MKRSSLCSTMRKMALNGAPVWSRVIQLLKYTRQFQRVQKNMLLRLASAFKTVYEIALQVITGTGIDALVQEGRMQELRQGISLSSLGKVAEKLSMRKLNG